MLQCGGYCLLSKIDSETSCLRGQPCLCSFKAFGTSILSPVCGSKGSSQGSSLQHSFEGRASVKVKTLAINGFDFLTEYRHFQLYRKSSLFMQYFLEDGRCYHLLCFLLPFLGKQSKCSIL
jgi:hypothetical protein